MPRRIPLPLLTILLAPCLFPSSALGGALGCTDTACADTTNGLDVSIDCTYRSVGAFSCEPVQEDTFAPLLRIAVRCFDPGVAQARYKDVLGSFASFSDLTSDCDNFIASAQWIRGDLVDQGQCALDTPDSVVVPDCTAATQEDLDDMSQNLKLYSSIRPAAGANSCFTGPDLDTVEVRNGSFKRAYHGVLSGRYICSQTTSPTNLTVCDDGASGSQTRPDTGMYGAVSGFNLAPQSFSFLNVNLRPSGTGFDYCCDWDVPSEHDCDAHPSECSPVDIMCANAAIFSVCRGLPCEYTEAFEPLQRVVWLGPTTDVEPGDHPTVSPSQFAAACRYFSFWDTLDTEQVTDTFTFGPALPPSPVQECTSPQGNMADVDFDGVYDRCDPVVANRGPADGVQSFTLRNKVRNDTSFSQAFAAGDSVRVGGETAGVTVISSDELRVVVPSVATGPSTLDLAIEWKPSVGSFQTASQPYLHRWAGYVVEGTPNGLLAIDVFQEETARDGNFSPTNSYVNLKCGTGFTTVGSPWDVAARTLPTGAPSPNDQATREIYAVSDVLVGAQTQSRLLGLEVQTNRLLTADGVLLPDSGRALHVTKDANGYAKAYVARRWGDDASTISVVNIDASEENENFPLWAVKDGADSLIPPVIPGVAMGIRARHFAGTGTYAYVTSVECQNDVLEHPCPIGGCRDDLRNIYVSVVNVTDPEKMTMQWQDIHLIDSLAMVDCGDSESWVNTYVNLGLEFTLDGSKLLVANPEKDRLEVLSLPANTLGTPVSVGDFPVDVTVVNRGGDPENVVERAYVVNRSSQTVTEIDVANNFTRIVPDIDIGTDPDEYAVAIEARSDGMRLYTADWVHQTVGIIDLSPVGSPPVWVGEIDTALGQSGGFPTRLVLLRLPTP